ncbi:MAG TPA: restriction endonuclease [Rectinema sp.]|nr:restriction endonuclease [Rectinema sp.]HRU78380.1 restriction endonuclease [Rectinema sp.]
MEAFLVSAGVPKSLVQKYKNLYKFTWIKAILNDLDQMEDGPTIEKRILTELCKLRKLPDNGVSNTEIALKNLREIKLLAIEHDLFVEEERASAINKKKLAAEKARIIEERSLRLEKLHKAFMDGIVGPNRQQAGYSLEDILAELFSLFCIEYRKSYKISTQQIDGHFKFESFDYLVEAKWRADLPTEQEIAGFKRKEDTKLESTRGVFFSINGFRQEVVEAFQGGGNIVFFSGEDLVFILEGMISLDEVLRIKIEKAAQEGIPYFEAKRMR